VTARQPALKGANSSPQGIQKVYMTNEDPPLLCERFFVFKETFSNLHKLKRKNDFATDGLFNLTDSLGDKFILKA